MLRMVKIPRQLEIQPELRFDTKQSLQPKRSVRSHVALSMYKLIHTWIRYAEPIRELRLRSVYQFPGARLDQSTAPLRHLQRRMSPHSIIVNLELVRDGQDQIVVVQVADDLTADGLRIELRRRRGGRRTTSTTCLRYTKLVR